MKSKIIISILVVIGIIGSIIYLNQSELGENRNVSKSFVDELVVFPQEVKNSVTIQRVTLSKTGFIVIRGSDGKRIGQVIEISKYLPEGTNENIIIELGEFYTYTEDDQLIVMIYHDDGDKSFNELDQPINTSAVFAETGRPVLASIFEHEVAPADGMGMVTVRYTDSGFEPAKLTVPVGTMVEFINQSDEEMWVASNVHPEHDILPTFDQFRGVGKDKNYMYTFDKKGSWPYHDHIKPSFVGIINVQ